MSSKLVDDDLAPRILDAIDELDTALHVLRGAVLTEMVADHPSLDASACRKQQ